MATVLEFLRAGDELVVHRLDRLGRSTRHVLNLVHELDAKGTSLRVLEPEVTTAGDMGRIVITVLGMVADMELKFIRDRQRAGIEATKDGSNLGEAIIDIFRVEDAMLVEHGDVIQPLPTEAANDNTMF
ncbi:hypothetical protein GCM10017322_36840 [Paracoccus aerius]|nr:hypothetical protein GCM10017322_36840 [Paracoccus aerius]